jgi:hypothetical protein
VVEIGNVEMQSLIKMVSHDGLKAPAVERTEDLGSLFGLDPPPEPGLFIRREAQAHFRKMFCVSCLEC